MMEGFIVGENMPYNVNKQIQEAMERGDFNDLPGKGKPQQLYDNPYIPPEVRQINQMLKDNGFAPHWIEVDKRIRDEREQIEKLLTRIQARRERLANRIRVHPLKRDAIRRVFELERTRALEAYTVRLRQLNQKIQQFNLMIPLRDKQLPLYNLDAATARFHKQCPRL
jgi:DnaJ family protein C protein 28